MANQLEIVIRNSTGPPGDEVYPMSSNDTIAQLKSQIEVRHPSHPLVENQRLIFCGRVLENEKKLSEIGAAPDESNRFTILLFFRSPSASSPPPQQQPPQQVPQFIPPNGMPFPPNAAFYGHGMPVMNPMMGAGHFPMAMNNGFFYAQPGMPPLGQPGYPGMMGHQQARFAWQGGAGAPPMMPPMNGPQPQVHRFQVQLNLRYMFGLAVLAFLILIQGGPNSYYWSALVLTLAFLYLRPRGRPAQQQQPGANPNNNAAGPGNANQNANNGNNNGRQQERNGFDDMEVDPNAANWENVPSVLRYDWRHHTGVVGEVLGFFCPLVFSLWPSWDPSLLGDHPDLIRRRQEEQQQQQNAAAPQQQQDAPAVVQ